MKTAHPTTTGRGAASRRTLDELREMGKSLRQKCPRSSLDAAPRDGRLAGARFAFGWQGGRVAGEFSADFSGARPGIGLNFNARNVALGGALARAGYNVTGLRASEITVSASATGARLDELLETGCRQAFARARQAGE